MRLNRACDLNESAFAIVDLVHNVAAQTLPRKIESLERVVHAVQLLASQRAFEYLNSPAKIDNIRHDQLGGGAGCLRAQIGAEIADRKIDLVPTRGNNRHSNIGNRARDNFLIELPQIFHAAPAARDDV